MSSHRSSHRESRHQAHRSRSPPQRDPRRVAVRHRSCQTDEPVGGVHVHLYISPDMATQGGHVHVHLHREPASPADRPPVQIRSEPRVGGRDRTPMMLPGTTADLQPELWRGDQAPSAARPSRPTQREGTSGSVNPLDRSEPAGPVPAAKAVHALDIWEPPVEPISPPESALWKMVEESLPTPSPIFLE